MNLHTGGGCLSGGRLARCPGQCDGERGPVPLDTLHGELSGVRRHNFLHNVQSQPGPPGLVVYNGSKICSSCAAGMPLPVSCTCTWVAVPWPASVSLPPWGMASSAFCTRFSTA